MMGYHHTPRKPSNHKNYDTIMHLQCILRANKASCADIQATTQGDAHPELRAAMHWEVWMANTRADSHHLSFQASQPHLHRISNDSSFVSTMCNL
jgi:hypothetical protein